MKKALNYTPLTTHGVEYRYTRLPFGIKTAKNIFVEEINKILYYLPGVIIVIDDILIYGSTIQEHNECLELVELGKQI